MSAPDPPTQSPPAPGAQRRRAAKTLRRAGVAAVLLPPALLGGLSQLHGGEEPAVTPWRGPTPARVEVQPPPQPGADLDGDGLEDAVELDIARRHAPRYRFTAGDPSGPGGAQNRDEDYLPMSVARFLDCLDAGVFELRGVGAVRATTPGRFEAQRVVGFPSRLAGDPLGASPVYTHVYPGARPGEAFCEYWVFYGYDRADARVLGVPVPLGDHRGDWEHTAYRVSLDPPQLLEGFYYGHALALRVDRADLERAEGEHPVVYVSQGKHASYPAPCVVASTPLPHLIQHLDVANGLGPTWDSWRGPVVDLGEADAPRPAAQRWLGFRGRWGPDGVTLFGLELGTSPTGPAAKVSWGHHGPGIPWRQHLSARGGRLLPGQGG